jgi:ABC-type polysaccharide/polyol phosphate transport system ATPase subunit
MSDAVRARGLTKSYRLYSSYAQRALDALGLLTRGRRDRIPEHVALRGVDLQIRRGEKVAIIGRNGAGKSTLLKLVTGVLQPTAGRIEVSGNVKALLEIGAGFHPELTGRQNVLGYLGHLGVTAAAAERALAEIVEFAEVEEYLGQPMKTYSAGMAMRLMFSAATQIAPDILVLDEVLSVGDAYFNQKSFGRIRDLCAARDATLLLVTHDIYAARSFCERFVWIDAGVIRADGDPVAVVQEYEQSVRVQAEAERSRRTVVAAARVEPESVVLEIGAPRDDRWSGPVWFRRVALYAGGRFQTAGNVRAAGKAGRSAEELERAGGEIVEQVIRPTGLLDPTIEIRPVKGQVDDLLAVVRDAVGRGERVLVTTLTKRMAEELTNYFSEVGVRCRYLHSDIETLDRVAILTDFRRGVFDCLIGINLLREGLDLPEVAVVAILDADKEGFLRSQTSLIQTAGRAARNLAGRVLFYADAVTDSMRRAMEETTRRRTIQERYNTEHGVVPASIVKEVHSPLVRMANLDLYDVPLERTKTDLPDAESIRNRIADLEKQMKAAAKELDFERAAALRDEIRGLRELEIFRG